MSDDPRPGRRLTAQSALDELLAGNARFVDDQLTSLDHHLILRARSIDKQEPFAAVLACADSRIPVELIFDQTIGHIFVTRIAGNIATPEIIGSLEFAVAVLGVKTLLVLGHSSCGAVTAAMSADPVPGQIGLLFPHMRPAIEHSGGNLREAIEANARLQSELLRTSSPVISGAVTAGNLSVAAAVYDLASGRVSLL